ncbi:MAG: hypothetical protein ACLGH7_00985, partial [Actinomycetes bacterium]
RGRTVQGKSSQGAAGGAASGRSQSKSRHPAGRALPPAGTPAGPVAGRAAPTAGQRHRAPAGYGRHGRNTRAKHDNSTSAGMLAVLAAVVIFAVYVLPWLIR